jgi:hypothetical protein
MAAMNLSIAVSGTYRLSPDIENDENAAKCKFEPKEKAYSTGSMIVKTNVV